MAFLWQILAICKANPSWSLDFYILTKATPLSCWPEFFGRSKKTKVIDFLGQDSKKIQLYHSDIVLTQKKCVKIAIFLETGFGGQIWALNAWGGAKGVKITTLQTHSSIPPLNINWGKAIMLTIFDYLLHFWLSFEIEILFKIKPSINDFTTFIFWNIKKHLKKT